MQDYYDKNKAKILAKAKIRYTVKKIKLRMQREREDQEKYPKNFLKQRRLDKGATLEEQQRERQLENNLNKIRRYKAKKLLNQSN